MARSPRMAFGIFAACAALAGSAPAADVSLSPGQPLVLEGVQFTPKGTLAPGAQPELDALGTYLASHPDLAAQITAFAPRQGGVKAADRRAKAIRDYVVKKFRLDKRQVLARGRAAAKGASPADEAKIEVAALSATLDAAAEEPALGLGLDLSGEETGTEQGDATASAETSHPEDPDQRPAAKPHTPAEPLTSKLHLGIALAPSTVFGLPNTYLAGDLELRASFAALPFLHVMLAGGAGERLFLGTPLVSGPRYVVLGTWHAGLGVQAPFGDERQGPFAELVAGWRSFTAAASELGYLSEVGRFEVLAGGGGRMRVADYRLDLGLRLGYAPGARSAFGLPLLVGGWIF